MSKRILITGSSDGLGSLTARLLISQGHKVVLHARNTSRAKDAVHNCPGAETVITGDLSTLSGMRDVASQANALGTFDTIMHNAGLYLGPVRRTSDGLPALVAVNTVAPYVLTCLINRPQRLVYVSSGLHRGGSTSTKDLEWQNRNWQDMQAYSDSKFHNVVYAFAMKRLSGVETAAVDPGWVATKMGGASASDDLDKAVECFAKLAVEDVGETGYWYQSKRAGFREEAKDFGVQDGLFEWLKKVSGTGLPEERI